VAQDVGGVERIVSECADPLAEEPGVPGWAETYRERPGRSADQQACHALRLRPDQYGPGQVPEAGAAMFEYFERRVQPEDQAHFR
jgi:hypothetical protein